MAADHDLSLIAGHVVSSALHNTRDLFCPFCTASFLFEFTLKDHLKAAHRTELAEQLSTNSVDDDDNNMVDLLSLSIKQLDHTCPFCNAAFMLASLIPKHIANYHGNVLLRMWQQQAADTAKRPPNVESNDPTTNATNSPGLSAIFKQISTDDTDAQQQPPLKSILKRIPAPGDPTTSAKVVVQLAPGVTIRRSKSDVVKRTLSVRRELRFDPSTKQSATLALSPRLADVKKKATTFGLLRNPFAFALRRKSSASGRSSSAGAPLAQAANNQLITSTPISGLDTDNAGGSPSAIGRHRQHRSSGRNQMDNWKASVRNVTTASTQLHRRRSHRGVASPASTESPLLHRYRCASCKRSYANNADLLNHLREHHRGIKHWLRPQYACAACDCTFYSNNYLIRHCHAEHRSTTTTTTATTLLGRRHSMR